jgi:hypothetical protein
MNYSELINKSVKANQAELNFTPLTDVVSLRDALEFANWYHKTELGKQVIASIPCHHYFVQKDEYWKSCNHCGTLEPLTL